MSSSAEHSSAVRAGAAPTKAARQARIAGILRNRQIRSQSQLAQALLQEGLAVTQATLSRDLVELGAVKVRPGGQSTLIYAVPDDGDPVAAWHGSGADAFSVRLRRLSEDLIITAEASANLVVLRVPPGAAQFLASAIDRSALPGVLGTIAGDDTVLVITRDPLGGEAMAARFLALAAGEDVPSPGGPQAADS